MAGRHHANGVSSNVSTVVDLAALLNRFSVDMTGIVDDAMGTEYAGNREIRAIVALLRGRPLTTRALAEHSGLSRSSVSRLLHRLESGGLIKRARSPHDRRAVVVELTAVGRRRGQEMADRLDQFFDDARLIATEIVELLESHTDDLIGGPPGPCHDPLDLLDRVSTVGVALDHAVSRYPTDVPVTGRQLLALLWLSAAGKGRPSQLALHLKLTSGGVTYIVDHLESSGLATRQYGALDDRRAVTIIITEAGRHAATCVYSGIADVADDLHQLFLTIQARAEPV